MDWDEAVKEAKSEIGYSEDEYVDNWARVVEVAKEIIEYAKEEEYFDFCEEAKIQHQEYLKSERWQKLRLRVLKRDSFLCQDCKLNPAKEVHHSDYDYLFTPKEFDFCISLCSGCHKKRHGIGGNT